MINYATGYAFNLAELFENFDSKRLSINSSKCIETLGYVKKREIVFQVFIFYKSYDSCEISFAY